jgi:hypothetical protein
MMVTMCARTAQTNNGAEIVDKETTLVPSSSLDEHHVGIRPPPPPASLTVGVVAACGHEILPLLLSSAPAIVAIAACGPVTRPASPPSAPATAAAAAAACEPVTSPMSPPSAPATAAAAAYKPNWIEDERTAVSIESAIKPSRPGRVALSAWFVSSGSAQLRPLGLAQVVSSARLGSA